MSKYLIQDSTLISIADAIRSKTGESSYIPASIMMNKIASIEILDKSEDILPYEYASSNIISFNSNARYILNSAFSNCKSLTTVSFPNCISIGINAFYTCYSLTTISFPACINIRRNAFCSCYSLKTVNFPNCVSVGESVFGYCSSLTTASFPKCTTIGSYAFRSCWNLISLYLTESSVVNLEASNIFNSTPIGGYSTSAGRYGSVYVPSSLLTAYGVATNWSTISERIVGI